MQLLLLDIMLSTLVTIDSAGFNYGVRYKGKVIMHFLGNEQTEYRLQARAAARNCAALFESCVGKRCCGNYELANPVLGIPTQAPPGTRIKCSAASTGGRHDRMVYTRVSMYPKDSRYYARKSLMSHYCLPRTILKHGK